MVGVMSRLPPSPSMLDKIMVDSYKEYSQVVIYLQYYYYISFIQVLSLLTNISVCGGVTLHPGIQDSVNHWWETVLVLHRLGKGGVLGMDGEYYLANCSKAVRRLRYGTGTQVIY